MSREKKFINDPKKISSEALAGYLFATSDFLRAEGSDHVIVANELAPDRVGILIGGGIAAEPLFMGYVGKNMADCAVIGNINAAPAPDLILKGTQAINRGKGVLYIYNNYPGDILCFDMAAELAEEEGIETRTVRNCDDVGSAASDKRPERRGIVGAIQVIKVAAGAASTSMDLDGVFQVARRAAEQTSTLIVAAKSGSYLENGEMMFNLADDEIEIGVGFHGEPGLGRQKMKSADEVVDVVLDTLLADLHCGSGDRVAVLVNSMGATSITELFIINNHVTRALSERGIALHRSDLGFFYTSQNMSGFSISMMKLDDELAAYYDLPAYSFSYKR